MATGFLSVSLLGFVLLLAIVFTARFLIIILLDVSGRLGWRQADDLHRVMTSVSVRKTVTTSTMAFIAASVAAILLLAHLSPSRNAVDGIPNDLFIGLGLVGAAGAFFFGLRSRTVVRAASVVVSLLAGTLLIFEWFASHVD